MARVSSIFHVQSKFNMKVNGHMENIMGQEPYIMRMGLSVTQENGIIMIMRIKCLNDKVLVIVNG